MAGYDNFISQNIAPAGARRIGVYDSGGHHQCLLRRVGSGHGLCLYYGDHLGGGGGVICPLPEREAALRRKRGSCVCSFGLDIPQFFRLSALPVLRCDS